MITQKEKREALSIYLHALVDIFNEDKAFLNAFQAQQSFKKDGVSWPDKTATVEELNSVLSEIELENKSSAYTCHEFERAVGRLMQLGFKDNELSNLPKSFLLLAQAAMFTAPTELLYTLNSQGDIIDLSEFQRKHLQDAIQFTYVDLPTQCLSVLQFQLALQIIKKKLMLNKDDANLVKLHSELIVLGNVLATSKRDEAALTEFKNGFAKSAGAIQKFLKDDTNEASINFVLKEFPFISQQELKSDGSMSSTEPNRATVNELLLQDIDDSWASLQSVLEKNLDGLGPAQKSNQIAQIKTMLTPFNKYDLEGEDIIKLRKKLKELSDLYSAMQPGSVINNIGTTPRRKLKSLLNKKHIEVNLHDHIDPQIEKYLMSLRSAIANEIGYRNAQKQTIYLRELGEKYPGHKLELLVLKRHEVSSNMGDALQQKPFDLESAMLVQTMQRSSMKENGAINHVDLMVSPVKRSVKTAIHATVEMKEIDKVLISSALAEKQHVPSFLSFSSRTYNLPSAVARQFQGILGSEEPQLVNLEEPESPSSPDEEKNVARPKLSYAHEKTLGYELPFFGFKTHPRKEMYSLVTEPFEHGPGGMASERIVVFHGGAGLALAKYLQKIAPDKAYNFPEKLEPLDYGSQYNIVLIRDDKGEIITTEYLGAYERFGAHHSGHTAMKLEDRLENMRTILDDKMFNGNALEGESLAQVLFGYCAIETSEQKVQSCINQEGNADLMLEHLAHLNFTDLKRSEYILKALFDKAQQRVDLIKNKSSWPRKGMQLLSGKGYDTQNDILSACIDLRTKEFKPYDDLKSMWEHTQKKIWPGKIINIYKAIMKLQEAKGIRSLDNSDDDNEVSIIFPQ